VLLLVLGGAIVYLLMSRSKQVEPAPQPAPAAAPAWTPPAPAPPSVAPPAAVDEAKTMLETPSKQSLPATAPAAVSGARLVVITGEALLDQPEFSLQNQETRLGRKESQNEIIVKDPEVSRAHAVITRQGQDYFIQDLNSTLGTEVNGVKFRAGPAQPLHDNDEISLGPRVKFQFRLGADVDNSETLLDMNVDDLRTKFGDGDPFRTEYDD
jgi:hypothetical protein